MDDPLDAILSSPELADLRTSAKATEVREPVLDGMVDAFSCNGVPL